MSDFETVTVYTPGTIGRVAELHALYYSREWNFGQCFEVNVATELSKFMSRYDESQDCVWSGLIAVDTKGARDLFSYYLIHTSA
jgi:hypothetical protein